MNILITVLLLVILGELTYMLTQNTRKISGGKAGRPIFIDTSVLIDGRIIALAEAGFMTSKLIVPRSVVGELQFLADNADHEKRARARHGLDIISELQKIPQVDVEILQDGSKAKEGVDERLLKLAKQYNGAILTIDFNLNKVAQVENISVLNINELSKQLRMSYLPGEQAFIELMQKGQDARQAVGYLADGTMVVVEHASKHIGTVVEVQFIRSLQTAAGKMMFAKLKEKEPLYEAQSSKSAKPTQKVEGRKKVKYPTSKQKPTQSSEHKETRAPRQKTSAQREASLIELVNRQD